ncbi:hypothetical protein BDR06DRAFT_1008612 [Suillus hirtellus]|nr:hypothetical protein BDR06DRAFT_1008612 [Suillus hirtellus]
MPHQSTCNNILNAVDQAALALAKLQYQDILDNWSDFESDTDSDLDSFSTSDDDNISLSFSPPSPISPIFPMTGVSDSSSDESDDIAVPYDRLQDTIAALCDKIKWACVLHKPNKPPPQAP